MRSFLRGCVVAGHAAEPHNDPAAAEPQIDTAAAEPHNDTAPRPFGAPANRGHLLGSVFAVHPGR
ncbi:hypothetical protein GCM10009680_04700 [Streptomyces yatensis]|uniref:Uncharacterized protein n=1 Tax=Streptomyces yatensis TaxID=155177 RepID=A0ABN2GAR7_9ACTN